MSGNRFILFIDDKEHEAASFRARERLNHLSTAHVSFVTSEALAAADVLGQAARLTIHSGDRVRHIAGIIDGFERGRSLSHGRASHRVRIVPRAALLRRRKRSAIFQFMTTLQIVRQVFEEHQVDLVTEVVDAGVEREVCIQHEETDWDFVTRLLAEEGFVFRVANPVGEGAEKIVVFDNTARYAPLPEDDHLVYRQGDASSAMVRQENHVSDFVLKRREGSKSVLLDEYDYKFPSRFSTSSAPTPALPVEIPRKKPVVALDTIVEPHGIYGEMQAIVRPAEVLRQQVVRRQELYKGKSACIRIEAGLSFQLDDHDDGSLSARYAIVEVRHQGVAASEGPTYENDFTAVSEKTLYRPARPERRVRQSLETATVVGPEIEEVYTDELGRIKVEFHWDLLGPGNERSSCWIRVSQNWAGSGWGFQFIPRAGMEVLVAYLGGDPDRPVVIGCLPNPTQLPPYVLPKDRARSGIKTRSTPRSYGYNEISFDDAAGGEELRLHAERDMNSKVKRNQTSFVGGDRYLDVSGLLSEAVAGRRQSTVLGPTAMSLQGGADMHVVGLYSERIEGDLATAVADDRVLEVEGSDRVDVRAHAEHHVVGPWTQRADSFYTLVVGTQEAAGHADFQIRGSYGLTVDDKALIEAHEGLTIRCGDSSIEMTRDGITLTAPSVTLKGGHSVTLEGDGPALRLDDKAELVADTIKIYAKESSLEMDQDASLKGKTLYLNCKMTKPKSESEEEETKTKKLAVQLSDENFEPYKNKHYQLRAEGERFEGVTGGDGSVEHDIPESTKTAVLTVWIDEYPTGRKREYAMVLAETPPIDTMAGVKVRLKNLGYYHGAVDTEELDPAAVAALKEFQRDHELVPNGEPDDPTKAALVKRYGH